MDQTITAIFESVDAATFAARRAAAHFDGVRSIKIQHRALDRPDSGRAPFLAWEAPTAAPAISPSGSGMPMAWAGGIAPFSMPMLMVEESDRDEPPPPRERARLQITADVRIAGKIAAALLASGGWEVRS